MRLDVLIWLGVVAVMCMPIALMLWLKLNLIRDQARAIEKMIELYKLQETEDFPDHAEIYQGMFGAAFVLEDGITLRLRQRRYTRGEIYTLAHWLNSIHADLAKADQIAQEVQS